MIRNLKALGKTLKGGEKELFNAITDTKNHATIETVQSDPNVDFGRSDGSGKNTVDFADIDLLDAPKNAGGITSVQAVGHETLEAYASSKGKNFNDAHKFANKFFGGLDPPLANAVQIYSGPSGILGVTMELPVHGKTNIREQITRQFVTPIPMNTVITGRIPGHIVDVEKKPMTKNYLLSVVVALLIPGIKPTNQAYSLQSETQSLEAVGTVVAYDQLVPLTNITWILQSQVLLIRISKSIKGRAAGPYIKVVYKYAANDSPLPQNIFDANTQWRSS